MEKNDEETLAVKIEILNEKLDYIINKQKEAEKELQKNNKVVMQRINKIQEYNEIDDMRNTVLNNKLNTIMKRIVEIDKKLY
ncbi:MAG: hypothetical protein ACI4VC_04620 [Clostridia bacterium]